MKSIHLVSYVSGSCCDRREMDLRAFADKHQAEMFQHEETVRIGRELGKLDAVRAMMEPWHQANPRPVNPADLELDSWQLAEREAFGRKLDQYYADCSVEEQRLTVLVGGVDPQVVYEPDFRIVIHEIPFGFPTANDLPAEDAKETH